MAASLAPSVDVTTLSTLVPLGSGDVYDPSAKPGVNVDWVLTVRAATRDFHSYLLAVHSAVAIAKHCQRQRVGSR